MSKIKIVYVIPPEKRYDGMWIGMIRIETPLGFMELEFIARNKEECQLKMDLKELKIVECKTIDDLKEAVTTREWSDFILRNYEAMLLKPNSHTFNWLKRHVSHYLTFQFYEKDNQLNLVCFDCKEIILAIKLPK